VTLNTDNRLITNTTMTNEYCLAYEEFDFTPREILTIVMNGVKSAFIPYEIKRDFIQRTKATTKDMLLNYAKKHGYKDQISSNSNNYA
jgi:adenosine deaminase